MDILKLRIAGRYFVLKVKQDLFGLKLESKGGTLSVSPMQARLSHW